MTELSEQEELSLVSKGLYGIVRDIIGPECIVKLRRQQWDVQNLILERDTSKPELLLITRGSMSEGFKYRSSDVDTMLIDRRAFVCTDSYRFYKQGLKSFSLFLTTNEECSPGFTLLECLMCDRKNVPVFNCLSRKDNKIFLSSKAIRDSIRGLSILEPHGPCQTYKHSGLEIDVAYTLSCPVWPEQAMSFITRSVDRGWPSNGVLEDITNDGCLFVPINSKQQTYTELMDLEWRMSFSLAEQKLINAMNHCQFLCYGLFKLILKEALKEFSHIHDLLCSFFMKTAVFWELHECSQDWIVETFLCKFWNVFRRLASWVSNGYCPNFFVPENNMFYGKIRGRNQRKLLSVLRKLYSDGNRCLLRCKSLNDRLTEIISKPYLADRIPLNEEEYIDCSYIDIEKLYVVMRYESPIDIDDSAILLSMLNNVIHIKTQTDVMLCTVKLRVNFILQKYAESILMSAKAPSRYRTRNRKQYLERKPIQRLLHRSKTFFCSNYFVHAQYAYITGHYRKARDILLLIKDKLQTQACMYEWNLKYNVILDRRKQRMPYDTLIKSFIVRNVVIKSDTSIDELKLECQAELKNTGAPVNVPPLVFTYFLLILCYTRLGDYRKRYSILKELQTLIHLNRGNDIRVLTRAISWEILGISQQICGERRAAFLSYIFALYNEFNYFNQATIFRIRSLFKQA